MMPQGAKVCGFRGLGLGGGRLRIDYCNVESEPNQIPIIPKLAGRIYRILRKTKAFLIRFLYYAVCARTFML